MGRPRKFENSRSRSFLLPGDLLDKIEAAAEKRKLDASDVVRELLETNIARYLRESDTVWRRHLREAIAAAKEDPAVLDLFEKYKDRKQLVLPLNSKLKKAQLLLLMEALEAHRALRDSAAQDQADDLHPLLREMAEGAGEKMQEHLGWLNRLYEDGKLWLDRDAETEAITIKVGEAACELLDGGERGDPAINGLRTLIKEKLLKLVGQDTLSRDRGREYQLNPARRR
jgi:hypothetical protein